MKIFLMYFSTIILVALLGTSCGVKENKPEQSGENAPETLLNGSGDDEGDQTDSKVVNYSVMDLQQAARKATSRYEKLALVDSTFIGVKTWKTEKDVWVKLEYETNSNGVTPAKEYLFLGCHFHGKKLSCHKKSEIGPSEPIDTNSVEDELQPL